MPKYKKRNSNNLFIIFSTVLLFTVTTILAYKFSSAFIKVQGETGKYNPDEKIAYFNGSRVVVPGEIKENWADTYVLGTNKSRDNKRIEVDLTNQKLYAYEGNDKVYEFKISSGKWGATPTGEFRIWTKLKYTLMTGGSKERNTYYYLPNVPYTMYFYGPNADKALGFGIHGTYWHDNFGHPMSHGCINMKTEEVEQLFYWAEPEIDKDTHRIDATKDNQGTRVIIYGDTPTS